MTTHPLHNARIRRLNDRPFNTQGRYVLYWSQMFRRLHANHALDHALALATEHGKPLVVYEALKLNYPWANARIHTFVLQGMRDNARAAQQMGVSYWPFVETPDHNGHGLVKKLAADAVCIVTDDYPAFIVPAHNRALAARCDVPLIVVDSNGIVPLALLGDAVGAAAHLRPRIHKLFAEAWNYRASREPVIPPAIKTLVDPPFEPWDSNCVIADFVTSLPLDASVAPVVGVEGGTVAGQALLTDFVRQKLHRYAQERNNPDAPARAAASGLSAHIHFGHLAIQEVAEAVLGKDWTPREINPKTRNKDDFFCRDTNVNSFLDEAITWRDLGHHWHFVRLRQAANTPTSTKSWQQPQETVPQFNFESMDFSPGGERTLDVVLPDWAQATLRKHTSDPREYLYTLEEFEAAATHDELWNAAQTELLTTGRVHNYLRMLWGKKVIEWSRTPAEAYRILEHLNNKYALDGRDPNSYSGIHWCFGLFDRPWAPERKVFGTVRYMSSENTARKFDLEGYLAYVRALADSR